MAKLLKRVTTCPSCHKNLPAFNGLKYCPYCGEELPIAEEIETKMIFAIEERQNSNVYVSNDPYQLYIIVNDAYNKVYNINGSNLLTNEDDIKKFIEENSSLFTEVLIKNGGNRKVYINKEYLIDTLIVTYDFSVDEDNNIDEISAYITIENSNTKIKLQYGYSWNPSRKAGDSFSSNFTELTDFTNHLYTVMKTFSLLPSLKADSNDIHPDFCPYVIRDVVENTILQFSEEYPDEYASAKLLFEVGE